MKHFLTASITIVFVCFSFIISATEHQKDSTLIIDKDDAVLAMIDSALNHKYLSSLVGEEIEYANEDSLSAPEPLPNDSILALRLKRLDAQSPFQLNYNQHVRAFINLYVNKKRKLSQEVLGLQAIYYPMIEEALDRHQLPLELKHLAVVESALNPGARSRVGAQGLWQFMYRTGKMYGLKVDSYTDDRMDPYLATDAACRYLKDLYQLYGDWPLVLAAYNSGPGNVNKAIRRSGGKKNYWEIRAFLPRETRGYVPAFIAVNYMMNYSEEHNLLPSNKYQFAYLKDTIHTNKAIHFSQLSNYLKISEEQIKFLNPRYKLAYVPANESGSTICLPPKSVAVYLSNESKIYADIQQKEIKDSIRGVKKKALLPPSITHTVRSGEFLGSIANRYRVRVSDLMRWNNRRSTRINPGDKLVVYTTRKAPSKKKQTTTATANLESKGKFKVHTVRRGDTLWDIAKIYNNTSVNDLKRLNSNLNFKRLKPGMRIKVKEIS